VPCAFITGITGQFFRQFALTIAVSTVISAFNSLTLSPALAALLLKPHGAKRDPLTRLLDATLGWFFRLFNWGFTQSTGLYVRAVGMLLRTSLIALVIYGGLLYLTYRGFAMAPTGFIPEQDKGYLLVNVQLPDGASVERTQAVMRRVEALAHQTDGVAHTVAISGQSLLLGANAPNFGSMYVMLKEFHDRRGPKLTGNAIAAALRDRCEEEVREALVSIFGAPPVDGLGNAGGFKMMVEDRGNRGLADLQEAADGLVADGTVTPGLQGVFTSLRADTPWIRLDIDRLKAKSMGVSLGEVFNSLQIYVGSLYVNNFNEFGRSWQVNVQADAPFRRTLEDIKQIKVRGNAGQMVPLSALAGGSDASGPVMLVRYNMYPAAAINGNMAPGTSSGQAVALMEQLARRQRETHTALFSEWTELTLMQNLAGNTAMYVFALAVVLVFLVLAAQYESWSLPLAVILVVPMCLLCSIAGVALAKMDVNIFTQIGFIVLVGLASKNAILIVEFAKQQRESGQSPRDATLEACRLRLRPIMMTSLAFILGVVPLMLAEGAGAEMRRTLGTAVFSGMLGVTLFGIFLTPVFFYVINRLGKRAG
jgi:hydrophobe/amphiphile efflux-1 (HAE1) family protein